MFDAGSGEGTSFRDILEGLEIVRAKGKRSSTRSRSKISSSPMPISIISAGPVFGKKTGAKIHAHLYDVPVIECYKERMTIAGAGHGIFFIPVACPKNRSNRF